MPVSFRTLTSTVLSLFLAGPTLALAQTPHAVVRGEVVDGSGGVLPGVTVVATLAGGKVFESVVTDGTGSFVFSDLPAGPVTLGFDLQGFDPASIGLVAQAHGEAHVVQRLGVARVAESVDVVAKAPEEAPPPPPPLILSPVPVHDQDSVCGPAKPSGPPPSLGTIQSRRLESKRGLYAKGDELVIDGGTQNGLEVGRNFVVRHYFHIVGESGQAAMGEHTSGLLQIVSADQRTAMAIVVYACDELMKGDFLAAFTPEPLRSAEPFGTPAYGPGDAARILFADAGSMFGVARRLMVIDKGSDRGIRVGQRLTLFRRERSAPDVIGDAVVVAVKNDSATIRVERAVDAVASGDWAAPQRPVTAATAAATGTSVRMRVRD
jgi:hypothetical protein